MPHWNQIVNEIDAVSKAVGPAALDVVRRGYLAALAQHTGRNVIAYYSGWLTKPPAMGMSICDDDKNGFMAAIHGLDRTKGLDLIIHTPGGDIAATESLVGYLRKMFGDDIRAIVPQIAMSAGTMIACACKQIIMGKHSNLGPIDPQVNGVAAQAVLDEFAEAVEEVKKNPAAIPMWQAIIGKYHPTFLGSCQRAIAMSQQIVTEWLSTGMFRDELDATGKAQEVVKFFSDHVSTKTHSRHIHLDDCVRLGMNMRALEDDQQLQELVLSIHHAAMYAFAVTPAFKFIENHQGQAYFRHMQILPPPAPAPLAPPPAPVPVS